MADESVGRGTVTRSQARGGRGGAGLSEKFNILLALAKRLMELHRAALERELQKAE
jgi:hypothetical protein